MDGYINTESRHSLPRLHFEDLKFLLGGNGIQNQTRPWAEEQDTASCGRAGCGVEGPTRQDGPVAPASELTAACPGPHDEFLSFLIVTGVKNSCKCFKKAWSRAFGLQVILGLPFYRLLFWKKYFRLRIPGSAQQNWPLLTPTLPRLWM